MSQDINDPNKVSTNGLNIYDEALRKKLLKVFPNVVIAPPDDAFTRSEEKGKIKLPLISAWRLSNPINLSEVNHYEAFRGRIANKTFGENNSQVLRMKGMPVTITYQIDIWAQLRDYADSIYRELTYFLWVNPNLQIEIPNSDSPFDFAITLTDIDNSTDYASFTDKNTVHRYTLTYEIPRARMFFEDTTGKTVKEIPVDLVAIDLNDWNKVDSVIESTVKK